VPKSQERGTLAYEVRASAKQIACGTLLFGAEDINFHSLRHTFASWAVMRGMDLYRLKEIMGHSDIQVTMRYAHLRPDATRKDMERFFGNGRQETLQEENERLRTEIERLQAENEALRKKLDHLREPLAYTKEASSEKS
jgi:hypothetical protein